MNKILAEHLNNPPNVNLNKDKISLQTIFREIAKN